MTKILSFQTHEIAEFISWSYFFYAWGIPAKFATITKIHHCTACMSSWIESFETQKDRLRATEAAKLYRDAIEILNEVDGKFDYRGVFEIFDANSQGDDILIFHNDSHITTIPCLRQQTNHSQDGICLCLADFIRPIENGIHDKIGVFVSSNAKEMEQLYPSDDYKHMLCQTLSDRLAEAGTEKLHSLIRRKYWGYAPNENLSIEDVLSGKYQGIRPAVGYPSLPDQSVIFILNQLIGFSKAKVEITETGAMLPHSSTCGLIFAHPQARYFNVGTIGKDQLKDYSVRRNMSVEQVKEYLRANIV